MPIKCGICEENAILKRPKTVGHPFIKTQTLGVEFTAKKAGEMPFNACLER